MAIIIDNSYYSSPTSIMACIDATSKIISCLNSRDRLMIYSSSCSSPLIITNDIRAQEIKTILDTIGHDTIKPKASYLRQSIQEAYKFLEHGGINNKHIAVLTCNPFALDKVVRDESIQIHVLCPGPLPWTHFKSSANSGWLLLSKPLRCSFLSGTIALHDRDIRRMLSQLRSARIPDYLERISITVIPRSQDVLQGILGATFVETMNVGESRTLLVKCDARSERRNVSVLEHFPVDLRTTSGQLDLEREIEVMLEHRQTPAIIVKVQYHHSALGSDTLCELTKDIFEHDNTSSEMSLEQAAVQDHMLYHLAISQANPRKAFAVLRSQAFENDMEGSIPYLHILLEELKHQARIQERYMLEKNQILPVLQRYNLFPSPSPGSKTSSRKEVSLSDRCLEPLPLTPRQACNQLTQAYNNSPSQRFEESPTSHSRARRASSRRAPSAFRTRIKDSAIDAIKSLARTMYRAWA